MSRAAELRRCLRAAETPLKARVTRRQWAAMLAAAGHACLRCGRRPPAVELCRDHVVPLCAGGEDTIWNSQPLCSECNNAKGDQYGPEWDFRPDRQPISIKRYL